MVESVLVEEIVRTVRRLGRVAPTVLIEPTSRLVEDLAIDSLDLVGLILQIQDDYGVVIEDDDVVKLRSVRDLAEYISVRRESSAAA